MLKILPATQEMRVGALGQVDHLEKEMATQSSILPGKWTKEPDKFQSRRLQESQTELNN